MSNVRLVSFGVDEDTRPLLDDQDTCVNNFRDWFWSGIPSNDLDQLIKTIRDSETDGTYTFCKANLSLDELVKAMKEGCEYPEWDNDGSVEKEFEEKLQQFKDIIGDRPHDMYTWSLEYDDNILVIFTD